MDIRLSEGTPPARIEFITRLQRVGCTTTGISFARRDAIAHTTLYGHHESGHSLIRRERLPPSSE
jgi:hypothetical protein